MGKDRWEVALVLGFTVIVYVVVNVFAGTSLRK